MIADVFSRLCIIPAEKHSAMTNREMATADYNFFEIADIEVHHRVHFDTTDFLFGDTENDVPSGDDHFNLKVLRSIRDVWKFALEKQRPRQMQTISYITTLFVFSVSPSLSSPTTVPILRMKLSNVLLRPSRFVIASLRRIILNQTGVQNLLLGLSSR